MEERFLTLISMLAELDKEQRSKHLIIVEQLKEINDRLKNIENILVE